MDYQCYCGATLKYSPEDNKWFCPKGHEAYSCKTCLGEGKNVPLQWIQQYQRWYCYECKNYAAFEKREAEKVEGYSLEIPKGSRIDEFCFLCQHLEFTQNNTHVICAMNVPRFKEPAISDITLRPAGSGKGISANCTQFSYPSEATLTNLVNWQAYIKGRLKKQIENHEKVAAPIETYRVDFIGGDAMALGQSMDWAGAKAYQMPVNRDSMRSVGTTVTIDKALNNVWVRTAKSTGIAKGVSKFMGAIAGSIEKDPLSLAYLQDLLKRDTESYNLEKFQIGEEPEEFWAVIDRGSTLPVPNRPREIVEQGSMTGPRVEVYEINYHMGRAYFEVYTGGRSDSKTKTMSLEPLKTSADEFQSKRKIVAVDHQSKTVWQWIGSKVFWKSGYQSLASDSTARTRHLTFIGSHIRRNIDDYEYRIIQEKEEPDQFKQLFPDWPR